jgi:hypothetical protein
MFIGTLAVLGLSGLAFGDTNGQGPAPAINMTWDATGDSVGPTQYNPNDFATSPTMFGTWNLGGTADNPGPPRTQTGWRYRGGTNGVDNAWSLTWDCVVNPDPFVDATINVTNNSASTQTFFIYMPLGIVPTGPATTMDGSVSAALSSQSFFNPATLAATATEPVYQAYIDGGLVKTLWNPGYSLVAAPLASAGDTTNFAGNPGPAAAAQIAILLKFTLSAGDSASVTGIFQINPVPGPAGLAAFAMFGVLAGGRRRRA